MTALAASQLDKATQQIIMVVTTSTKSELV